MPVLLRRSTHMITKTKRNIARTKRNSMIDQLLEKIGARKAVVGVIGLGYVGLPLVREFTRAGLRVMGFDIDERKVSSLLAGKSYIEHIPSSTVKQLIASGLFEPTTDFNKLAKPDCIIICVP